MTSQNTGHKGFTLLELLMVVIIIAILASIALPQYLRVSERSRASEALTILGALRASELRFKAQSANNVYFSPLAVNGLDIDIPGFGLPNSTLWTFSVNGAVAGSNGRATRVTNAANTIDIDLDNGATCTSTPATYGLTGGAC